MRPSQQHSRSGQAIIFLLAVMVIGLLLVMWNFDLHRVISAKVRVGNAGDAAAQSAARWQGVTMNMVGELNLIQAAMLLQEPDAYESVAELSTLRDRLTLIGPLMGFFEAQSVAFMNLKEQDRAMAHNGLVVRNYLSDRAEEYMAAGDSYYGIQAPYPEAWFEYGSLLYEISQVGLVVECANPKWYNFYNGSHILLDPGFYNAVLSSDWCWFERTGNTDLLGSFDNYTSWPNLPQLEQRPGVNSEYFGTGLCRVQTSLRMERNDFEGDDAAGLEDERADELEEYLVNDAEEIKGVSPVLIQFFSEDLMTRSFSWHFYDTAYDWSGDFFRWSRSDSGDFPFREGTQIRSEFNYSGADAAIDAAIPVWSNTPGIQMLTSSIMWRASAKPFGYLELEEGDVQGRVVPNYFDLVLPAFHQVRLIPNGISSRPHEVVGEGWEEHIYQHLPDYMNDGVSALQGDCYYCQALLLWNNAGFREQGARWLQQYGGICNQGSGGSGGSGGTGDWR